MYSKNLKSKTVHQEALLFSPKGTNEHFLQEKTVSPEELASFWPRDFLPILPFLFSSLKNKKET